MTDPAPGWRAFTTSVLQTVVPADWTDVDDPRAIAAVAAPVGPGFRPNAVVTTQPFDGSISLLSRLLLASLPTLPGRAYALACDPLDVGGVPGRRLQWVHDRGADALHVTVFAFATGTDRIELTVSQSLDAAVANTEALGVIAGSLRVGVSEAVR